MPAEQKDSTDYGSPVGNQWPAGELRGGRCGELSAVLPEGVSGYRLSHVTTQEATDTRYQRPARWMLGERAEVVRLSVAGDGRHHRATRLEL